MLSGVSITLGVLTLFSALVFLLGTHLFLRRRHLFPLKQRDAVLCVSQILVWQLANINDWIYTLPIHFPTRDVWNVYGLFVFRFGFTAALILRCIRLLGIFAVNKDANDYAIRKKIDPGATMSPYLKYRKFFNQKYLILYDFLLFLVNLTPAIIAHAIGPEDEYFVPLIAIVYILLYSVVTIVVIRKLKAVNENYHIRQELTWLIRAALLAIIEIVVLNFVFEYNDVSWFLDRIFYNFFGFFIMWASYYTPLKISYQRGQGESEESRSNENANFKRFEELLTDEIEKEKFKNFLIYEFSVENLLFWEEVSALKRKRRDGTDISEDVTRIYTEFIQENSTFWINLSGGVSREIKRKMESKDFDANVFEQAEKEIFQLMMTDSFMRYTRTAHAQDE